MDAREQISQILTQWGFTRMEADVYVCLLQQAPATGYRVAKEIGRSFPNTYRALERLQEKGAVLLDDGPSKVWRAVPLEELLDQVQSRFREGRDLAMAALSHLPTPAEDERIYRLETASQVITRARRVLDDAEERVLAELFPGPVETLRDAFEQTAARGVNVSARIYRPASLNGVHLVHSPFGEETLRMFRSEWLAIFVDGRQFLLGHLVTGGDAVHQAVWSGNPFLARAFYDHVNSDLFHYSFREGFHAAKNLAEAQAAYRTAEAQFPPGGDLGFREMQALLGGETKTYPQEGLP